MRRMRVTRRTGNGNSGGSVSSPPSRENLSCAFPLSPPRPETWARRRYAGTGRVARPFVRPIGALLWPAMIPDAVGLMLNDAGILPADERRETHQEDTLRVNGERPVRPK